MLRKILFLAAGFFFVFGFSNVSYFLPVYYDHIGIKSADATGWLVSIFYMVSVLFRPFLGSLIGYLGFRRLFYIAGILAVSSSTGIVLAGPHFWPGVISRALLGLASGMFQVSLATYQSIAFRPEERGRAFSLIMAGGLAPMVFLVPLAEMMLHRNYNTLYILFPLLLCVAAALLTPAIPDLDTIAPAKKEFVSPFNGLAQCLQIKPLRLSFLSVFIFSLSDASAAFMGSMTARFGLMASLFLSSNALLGVIMRLTCGRLLDKFHRGSMSALMTILTTGSLLLASIRPSEQSLIILGMIYGIGMGLGFPQHLALVSDNAPRELQAQAVSISRFLVGSGFAVIPLVSGWLDTLSGPVMTFRIITSLSLASAIGIYAMWKAIRNTEHSAADKKTF